MWLQPNFSGAFRKKPIAKARFTSWYFVHLGKVITAKAIGESHPRRAPPTELFLARGFTQYSVRALNRPRLVKVATCELTSTHPHRPVRAARRLSLARRFAGAIYNV